MRLAWIEGPLAVCRLPPEAVLPEWATRPGALFSAVRSQEELSVVCEAVLVPESVRREAPFLAIRVIGPLPFALVGVLTSILGPLAAAGISVFVVSSYDTDFVLTRAAERERVTEVLTSAGHEFA